MYRFFLIVSRFPSIRLPSLYRKINHHILWRKSFLHTTSFFTLFRVVTQSEISLDLHRGTKRTACLVFSKCHCECQLLSNTATSVRKTLTYKAAATVIVNTRALEPLLLETVFLLFMPQWVRILGCAL